MTDTTQHDQAEAETNWRRYCAAKDQAQREYEALYSKEASRNFLLMISTVIGLPAILIALGLPALLSILGAPVAFFIYMASEKRSSELRDVELASKNFLSFEQWEKKNKPKKSEEKYRHPDSGIAVEPTIPRKFDTKVSNNTEKNKEVFTPIKIIKIDTSRVSLKISTALGFLKSACKAIETEKALRPQENIKLIIADIGKIKRRKYLDLPQLIELKLQLDNIKDRFDPFSDEFVWEQLRLGSEEIQEIIDSNPEESDQSSQ
jgi:hypothetical protein